MPGATALSYAIVGIGWRIDGCRSSSAKGISTSRPLGITSKLSTKLVEADPLPRRSAAR